MPALAATTTVPAFCTCGEGFREGSENGEEAQAAGRLYARPERSGSLRGVRGVLEETEEMEA